jgi:hypothetical protein
MLYLRELYETYQGNRFRFCPLIMSAGRPQKADPGSLYTFAHQFYWDFRRLSEGRRRWIVNKRKLEQLEHEAETTPVDLIPEERERHERLVDEEIQKGILTEDRRDARLQEMKESQISATRDFLRRLVADDAREEVRVPGEPELIAILLNRNTTAEQLTEVCKEAVMTRTVEVAPGVTRKIEVPAWPLPPGSPFPTYLAQYSDQYVKALRDPRFPTCDVSARPSTRLKQFWFLSRALAGALFGVSTRTAINLVGSLRPEETFKASRDAKPERKRVRRKYKARS